MDYHNHTESIFTTCNVLMRVHKVTIDITKITSSAQEFGAMRLDLKIKTQDFYILGCRSSIFSG